MSSDDDIGMLHFFQRRRRSADSARNCQYPHVLGHDRNWHSHGSCLPSCASTTVPGLVSREHHQEFSLANVFEIYREWQQGVLQCQGDPAENGVRDCHYRCSIRRKIGAQHFDQYRCRSLCHGKGERWTAKRDARERPWTDLEGDNTQTNLGVDVRGP